MSGALGNALVNRYEPAAMETRTPLIPHRFYIHTFWFFTSRTSHKESNKFQYNRITNQDISY